MDHLAWGGPHLIALPVGVHGLDRLESLQLPNHRTWQVIFQSPYCVRAVARSRNSVIL